MTSQGACTVPGRRWLAELLLSASLDCAVRSVAQAVGECQTCEKKRGHGLA